MLTVAGAILTVGLAAAAFDLVLSVLWLALRYWWVWLLLGVVIAAAR